MARPRNVITHEMTSIGAEAIKLQQYKDTGLYMVHHLYNDGHDRSIKKFFINEVEAITYYNDLHNIMKTKQRVVNPPPMKLITKII